jgi:hypothetical protein
LMRRHGPLCSTYSILLWLDWSDLRCSRGGGEPFTMWITCEAARSCSA